MPVLTRRPLTVALLAVSLAVSGVMAPTSAGAAPAKCQGLTPTIAATAHGQQLRGTAGDDVIVTFGFVAVTAYGGGGDDLLCSSAGRSSELFGDEGDDTLVDVDQDRGDYSPNTLVGGPGDDGYVGTRHTILSYRDATAGLSIHAGGTVVDGADTETFVGRMAIVGGPFADRYVGTSGPDRYDDSAPYGADGSAGDVIRTGGGDDFVWAAGPGSTVQLGAGDDRAYALRGATVGGGDGDDEIDLQDGGTANGDAGDDQLSGSGFTFEGAPEPLPFRLSGGPGNDVLLPVYGIDEEGSPTSCSPPWCLQGHLVGGAGVDTLRLPSVRRRGTRVDLAAGIATTGGKNRSRVGFFERVVGSAGRDVILGDRHRNRLYGRGGNDRLVGRRGADVLVGGHGRDRAEGGSGRDSCDAEVRRAC
jgi:Ca2+-binding RTX toxin-like protein